MQAHYNQSAAKVTYDFSPENIALVTKNLSAKKTKALIAPIEMIKTESDRYNNRDYRLPDYKRLYKDFPTYLQAMAVNTQFSAKNSAKCARNSALYSAGGYVGIAGMIGLGMVTKYTAFFLLAKAPALLFAQASDYTDSWNLAFQGSYQLLKESRNYKKQSLDYDCCAFIENGHNINECLYPKETLAWAEHFKKTEKQMLIFE